MAINWDKKLNIRTAADHFEKEDSRHSRYEPSSYAVLERLAASGYIRRENTLVDYGCGRGRVGFFLSHATGCRSIGVEYNPALFADAQTNLTGYSGRTARVSFVYAPAEIYVPTEADCFYFFNPFSVQILRAVLGRIMDCYYENPRPMRLFVYYALDEWVSQLMSESCLQFAGEIDCRDLFHNDDPREKILIFELQPA